MNAATARAVPVVLTGWSGSASLVRVGTDAGGEGVIDNPVGVLAAGRAAVAGSAARWPLPPPPCWVRAGIAPASRTHGTR